MSLQKSKNIIIFGIIAFLAMNFWSLYSMDANGHMIHCPFMDDSSSFCQMTLTQHINQWQQFFAMIREKSLLLSLFSLLAFSVVVVTIATKVYERLKYQRFRNYSYWCRPEIKLFDYLFLAFSDGIIHSKIYA